MTNLEHFFLIGGAKGAEATMITSSYGSDFYATLTVSSGHTTLRFESEHNHESAEEAAAYIIREYDAVVGASDTRRFTPALEHRPAEVTIPPMNDEIPF